MGTGTMVISLASVIIGISLLKKVSFIRVTTSVIIGSIIYKACVAIAIKLGMPSSDLKMITAVLFLVILVLVMDRNCKILQNCHGRTGTLGRILKYTTDSAVTDIIFLTGNIHSIHQDLSGIHRYTAANDVQHGCLSGTIASDNGNKLAILRFEDDYSGTVSCDFSSRHG